MDEPTYGDLVNFPEKKPRRVTHIPLRSFPPNGACLNCGVPVQGRRRKYCSEECSREFWDKHNWEGIRQRVFKRDNYSCQVCG